MTAIGWRVKLGVLVGFAAAVAAVVIVLLAGGGSSPADSVTASRRALAVQEARGLLSDLALPARAVGPGQQASAGEVAALDRAVGSDVVERATTSSVDGSPAAVRAYLLAHPIRGTRVLRGGLGIAPRRLPPGIAAASVRLSLASAGPRETVVRAVAEVRWLVPRAATERVPADARTLLVTRGKPGASPGIAIRVGGARAARIAGLLNRLPAVQPGAVYHCPAAVAGLAEVVFTFRTRSGGAVLAQAAEDADVTSPTTACDALRFSVRGRALTPLLGGARLLREVSALLGRRLWLPPFAA